MIDRRISWFYIFIIAISGCALITHREELATLKQVGRSQDEIAHFVKTQKEAFSRLKEDITSNAVACGASKETILKKYGEPVLSRSSDAGPISEVFLYRHPTKYFSSDRIYLYFDNSGKLDHWEYKPTNSDSQ